MFKKALLIIEVIVALQILLTVGVAPRFAVGVVVGAWGDGAGSIHHGDVVALVVGEVVESVAAAVEVAAGEAGHLHLIVVDDVSDAGVAAH